MNPPPMKRTASEAGLDLVIPVDRAAIKALLNYEAPEQAKLDQWLFHLIFDAPHESPELWACIRLLLDEGAQPTITRRHLSVMEYCILRDWVECVRLLFPTWVTCTRAVPYATALRIKLPQQYPADIPAMPSSWEQMLVRGGMYLAAYVHGSNQCCHYLAQEYIRIIHHEPWREAMIVMRILAEYFKGTAQFPMLYDVVRPLWDHVHPTRYYGRVQHMHPILYQTEPNRNEHALTLYHASFMTSDIRVDLPAYWKLLHDYVYLGDIMEQDGFILSILQHLARHADPLFTLQVLEWALKSVRISPWRLDRWPFPAQLETLLKVRPIPAHVYLMSEAAKMIHQAKRETTLEGLCISFLRLHISEHPMHPMERQRIKEKLAAPLLHHYFRCLFTHEEMREALGIDAVDETVAFYKQRWPYMDPDAVYAEAGQLPRAFVQKYFPCVPQENGLMMEDLSYDRTYFTPLQSPPRDASAHATQTLWFHGHRS